MIRVIALLFVTVVVLVVVIAGCSGGGSESNDALPPLVADHWHAFIGVEVCGAWLPNAPTFEARADDPGVRAGIHSHGDGIIHLHPFATDEAGPHATVGRFVDYGGWDLSSRSMRVWDGVKHSNGTRCPGAGGPATVQWKVGRFGEPWPTSARGGDPARYRPRNGDIVALYFMPSGAPLPEPPAAQTALGSIEDLGGAPASVKPNGNG